MAENARCDVKALPCSWEWRLLPLVFLNPNIWGFRLILWLYQTFLQGDKIGKNVKQTKKQNPHLVNKGSNSILKNKER